MKKKIISVILAVMTLWSCIPMAYGETEEKGVPDLYGPDGSFGVHFYSGDKANFQAMVDHESAAYRVIVSNTPGKIRWNSWLSGLKHFDYSAFFSFHVPELYPVQFYKTILTEALLKTTLSDDYYKNMQSDMWEFVESTASLSFDALTAGPGEMKMTDEVSKVDKSVFKAFMNSPVTAEAADSIYDLCEETDSTVGEYLSALSDYLAFQQVSSEAVTALRAMRKSLIGSSNDEDLYILNAVNSVLDCMERSLDDELNLQTISADEKGCNEIRAAIVGDMLSALCGGIDPTECAKYLIQSSLSLTDAFFPATSVADSLCRICANYAFECVIKNTMRTRSFHLDSGEDYDAMVALYDLLNMIYMHGEQSAEVLATQKYKDGVINKIKNFFKKNNPEYDSMMNDVAYCRTEREELYNVRTAAEEQYRQAKHNYYEENGRRPEENDENAPADNTGNMQLDVTTLVTDVKARVCSCHERRYNRETKQSELTDKVLVFTYRIPKINLAGPDIDQINSELYNTLYPEIERAVEATEQRESVPACEEISYGWTVVGDVLSLKVLNHGSAEVGHPDSYMIYNVSISTGKRLSTAEFLPAVGMPESEYRETVREAAGSRFLNSYADTYEKFLNLRDNAGFIDRFDFTVSDTNIDNAQPYINDNGQLCAVVSIGSMAAASSYRNDINLEEYEYSPYYCLMYSIPEESITDQPENMGSEEDGKSGDVKDSAGLTEKSSEVSAVLASYTSQAIQEVFSYDYDSDGSTEAFAITCDPHEVDSPANAAVWAIKGDSATQLNKGITHYTVWGVYTFGDYSFLSLSTDAFGSGSEACVYGFRNGSPETLNISEQYNDARLMKLASGETLFMCSQNDFSAGSHDYVYYVFSFDRQAYCFNRDTAAGEYRYRNGVLTKTA